MKKRIVLTCALLVTALTIYQNITVNIIQADSGDESRNSMMTGLPLRINGRACTSFCLNDSGHAVFGSNYDNDKPEGMVFINKRGISKSGFMAGTTGKLPGGHRNTPASHSP